MFISNSRRQTCRSLSHCSSILHPLITASTSKSSHNNDNRHCGSSNTKRYAATATKSVTSTRASSFDYPSSTHSHSRSHSHSLKLHNAAEQGWLQDAIPSLSSSSSSPLLPSSSSSSSLPSSSSSSSSSYQHQPSSSDFDFDFEFESTYSKPTPPITYSPFDWRQRSLSRKNAPKAKPDVIPSYKRRVVPPDSYVGGDGEMVQSIRDYTEHFLQLLSLEEAEDEAVLRERLATWSLERLQLEGYALTEMSAYWLQENSFGRPVAKFSKGPGESLPEHKLENGTQVLISRIDPLAEIPQRGSVVSSSESHISICFPEMWDLDVGPWRLDLGRPNLVYERMRMALSHMNHSPGDIAKLNSDDSQLQYMLHGTGIRDALLQSFKRVVDEDGVVEGGMVADDGAVVDGDGDGQCDGIVSGDGTLRGYESMGAFRDDMRIQSWANRYSRVDPVVVEGDPVIDGLNPSQIRAMATMIGQRLSLIQGPPGTGKTKTIIETVKLLKMHFEVPQPILLCTYTNVAVDNLVEGFDKAGVKALRVGLSGNVKPSLIHTTLDFKLEAHPLHPKLCDVVDREAVLSSQREKLARDVWALEKKLKGQIRPRKDTLLRLLKMKESLAGMDNRNRKLRAKIFAIQQQMLREVVADADVICTTCVTAACNALNVMDFPIVFLDEASMSTEPASLIPIMKGSVHVSLIGDHKQLPPVIVSQEAEEGGLGVSLFERLTEEGLTPSVILDTQYRMHPAISRFPSQEFYNLGLSDGTIDEGGNIDPSLDPPQSKHLRSSGRRNDKSKNGKNRPSVVFLDHSGTEAFKGKSRVNVLEAQIVVSVVEDLLLNNPKLEGNDIGIIAPYAAQITLLTRMLSTDVKYQNRFRKVLGDQRAMQLPLIEVRTVDGFEGREKDVIIFSTVRNNDKGLIGFLGDKRRLNVGLTRAKRGLFVVGSLKTLRAGGSGGLSRERVLSGPSGTVRGMRSGSMAEVADVAMRVMRLDGDEGARSGMGLKEGLDSGEIGQVNSEGIAGGAEGGGGGGDGNGLVSCGSTSVQVTKKKKKKQSDDNSSNGGSSWARYADYVVGSGLVVRLSGQALERALYDHFDASRGISKRSSRRKL